MTDTERGILAAVLSEPGDDTHRLVYADYLEESGREKRARFIRCQVELQKLEGQAVRPLLPSSVQLAVILDAVLEQKRAELSNTARYMIQEWGIDELAGFPVPEEIRTVFRRGFVEEVTCTAEAFLKHADEMLKLTPLKKATLTTIPKVEYCTEERAGKLYMDDRAVFRGDPLDFRMAARLSGEWQLTDQLLAERFPGVEFTWGLGGKFGVPEVFTDEMKVVRLG